MVLHSWGHLRAQERAPQVKGEAACSEGREETSGCPEDQGDHRCCQPCRSFAAGFAAVLLEEMGCPRRGPVDGNPLPKLERCPCESAGETQRSWETAALCQPYCQPALGGMRSKPSQAACNSHPSTQWLRAGCSSFAPTPGFAPHMGSLNWNQRETVRGKSAFCDSESTPGLSESISCLRWCLASVGRGWGSFHFFLLTASSKGKVSCLCVCWVFQHTCKLQCWFKIAESSRLVLHNDALVADTVHAVKGFSLQLHCNSTHTQKCPVYGDWKSTH